MVKFYEFVPVIIRDRIVIDCVATNAIDWVIIVVDYLIQCLPQVFVHFHGFFLLHLQY